MMAIDAKFLDHIEKQFPGRDIPAHNDEDLHKHGSSTVRYGRGSSYRRPDHRCNMMCDPCFMDANQVGYVHELGWTNPGNSRQRSAHQAAPSDVVQFSGGEPTMSPYFLQAVSHARKIGYKACRLHQRHRIRQEQGILQAGL